MEYKIAICDDSDVDREYVTNMVKRWAESLGYLVQLDTFSTAEGFLFHYEEEKDYDILLLDEPFAFVAQKERENLLLAFLLAAEKYGKWTFLVSHESLSEKLACRFTLVNLEECK